MIVKKDGPQVHEEIMAAWGKENFALTFLGNPDPTPFIERFERRNPGTTGLWRYVPNRDGGIDLVLRTWEHLEARFKAASAIQDFLDVTYTWLSNEFEFGLAMGKLYPLFLGKKVVPYRHGNEKSFPDLAEREDVTCVIAAGEWIERIGILMRRKPLKAPLKAFINVCSPMTPELHDRLKVYFRCPIYNFYATIATGTVAMTEGNRPEPGEVGTLRQEARIAGDGELLLRGATMLDRYVGSDGWCSTGEYGFSIRGNKLFREQ